MSVVAAQGFRAAGVAAGLKSSGGLDVALVVNDGPRDAAADAATRACSASSSERLPRPAIRTLRRPPPGAAGGPARR